ncbi:MAG: hypothetical protein RLZZ127_33 [Planctomycetota bacterium]|jgi:hypothetical protein
MSRITGTVPARFKTRQRTAQSPMSFAFTADVRVEPAQPTPEAQAQRDAEWERFTAWAVSSIEAPQGATGAPCA